MNKTERKNKTNLVVNWPTHGNYFTISELMASNSHFEAEITLRVRLDNAIKKDKTVSVIGYKNTGKGRPKMVLAMNPVTQEFLDKAYNQDKIQPPDVRPVVSVININNNKTPISTSDAMTTKDIPLTEVSVSAPTNQVVST